jgi:hypothetical protein
MKITITEALAEIKTIGKRIEKKRETIGQYIARQDVMKDPFQDRGGSRQVLAAETQSIADLSARIVTIRTAIARANADTSVDLGGRKMTIEEWLIWRREVLPGERAFLAKLRQGVSNIRAQASQKQVSVRSKEDDVTSVNDIIVNIDEKALSDNIENVETIAGQLDGMLSLKNATTFVELPD